VSRESVWHIIKVVPISFSSVRSYIIASYSIWLLEVMKSRCSDFSNNKSLGPSSTILTFLLLEMTSHLHIVPAMMLAQASLKQRIDKAKFMKIMCVWWRLMKIHLKIVFLVY